MTNNFFDGRSITVNSTALIWIGISSACANWVISHNTFQGDSTECDTGIKINNINGNDRIGITGNTIVDMGTEAINLQGSNIDRPLIVGNILPDGITDAGATNTVIANNVTS